MANAPIAKCSTLANLRPDEASNEASHISERLKLVRKSLASQNDWVEVRRLIYLGVYGCGVLRQCQGANGLMLSIESTGLELDETMKNEFHSQTLYFGMV